MCRASVRKRLEEIQARDEHLRGFPDYLSGPVEANTFYYLNDCSGLREAEHAMPAEVQSIVVSDRSLPCFPLRLSTLTPPTLSGKWLSPSARGKFKLKWRPVRRSKMNPHHSRSVGVT
jgi:hypothetical protein